MKSLPALMAVSIAMICSVAAADTTLINAPEPTVNNHYTVSADWSVLKHGWSIISLQIADANSQPVDGADVTVDYEMTSMPMNPPKAQIEPRGNGVYDVKVFLGMRGGYKFDITITKGGVQDTLSTTQSTH